GLEGRPLVVICGFGPVGQVTGALINAPVVSSELGGAEYVAFDLNPKRVSESRAQGFPVFYGDGTQPKVLNIAGVTDPRCFVVTYTR
ncbi:unnamed protein product, partial [Phaeothamnion confervicola]